MSLFEDLLVLDCASFIAGPAAATIMSDFGARVIKIEPGFSVPGRGDHPTAVALFGAIVSGLYRREKTGKGGVVSTSLLANGLWSNACWMQAAICDSDFSTRLQRGQRGALTEIYRCKDNRWFMLVLLNQARE